MARSVRKPRKTSKTHAVDGKKVLPVRTAAATAASREYSLLLAIGFSVLVHAAALSLHFKFPEASRVFQDKTLDIILVNSKSARKPTDAQALAQNNLDGGGNTDQERRVKTPLSPSPRQQKGTELEQPEKRVQALEAKQKKLLAQARSKQAVAPSKDTEAQPEPAPAPLPSGLDLANSALEMMRLEGQIAKSTEEYNKRPRKKFLGTRTTEYRFARYIEDWRHKVERIGTLNYPEAAKGKLYGSLILTVTIKSDGTVDRIEINRSSGHKILDDAARRIVGLAGPFAAFSPDIRRDTDLLVITRSWNFTRSNNLETDNAK